MGNFGHTLKWNKSEIFHVLKKCIHCVDVCYNVTSSWNEKDTMWHAADNI